MCVCVCVVNYISPLYEFLCHSHCIKRDETLHDLKNGKDTNYYYSNIVIIVPKFAPFCRHSSSPGCVQEEREVVRVRL